MIRVMTVDDHPVYRDGLAALSCGDITIPAVARRRWRRKRFSHPVPIDRISPLMDLSMPVMGGAEAIERHHRGFEGRARIIALTTYEGDANIYKERCLREPVATS